MATTHDDTECQIIAIWADHGDEPARVRVLTADGYADWDETNNLTAAFPYPVRFCGVTPDGALAELSHSSEMTPYDDNDHATVTHTWTRSDGVTYATGHARRDGRA